MRPYALWLKELRNFDWLKIFWLPLLDKFRTLNWGVIKQDLEFSVVGFVSFVLFQNQ